MARRRRRAQEELLELLPETALELDPDTIYGPGEGQRPRGKGGKSAAVVLVVGSHLKGGISRYKAG